LENAEIIKNPPPVNLKKFQKISNDSVKSNYHNAYAVIVQLFIFLAHLTQSVMRAIAITVHL
jgi:hypothetical protein